MVKKSQFILIVILLTFSTVSYGQKQEIEKSVDRKDVPENAREWLKDTYEGINKVRWFFQMDGEKEVYEAKLRWKRKWHSVEFLPDGEVSNIEILIEFKDLEQETQQNITFYLNENYQRYKIDRIQIQYTGNSDELEDLIDENEVGQHLIKQYEIEYFGREDGLNKMWEGHFDSFGKFIKKRAIELSSTDILDF